MPCPTASFTWLVPGTPIFCAMVLCTAKTPYRKFETNIPIKGIVRSQFQFPHSCVCERFYIPTIDLPILLQELCGPILGKYKSLTDTWMWKLGLRPRNKEYVNGISFAVLGSPRINPGMVPCSPGTPLEIKPWMDPGIFLHGRVGPWKSRLFSGFSTRRPSPWCCCSSCVCTVCVPRPPNTCTSEESPPPPPTLSP